MTDLPKEGAGRPLYASAPKIAPALPAPQALWAMAVSYPLAYLYVKQILLADFFAGWGLPVFALLFVVGVEVLARSLHRCSSPEAPLWAGCWLVLSCAMPLWGWQPVLNEWQVWVWHLFAVWFVLARCGMLAQGVSGSLCWLDGFVGLVYLPFGNFFRRAATLWAGLRWMAGRRLRLHRAGVAGLTALVTLGLCALAWGQLAAADPHFAALGGRLTHWLGELLGRGRLLEDLAAFLLSLPVGAWLFGLVLGALDREAPPCPADRFFARLEPLRRLPAVTAVAAVGGLCLVYTLFFGLQAAEWLAADPLGLTAPQAATFAVDGFWELLRILLLDFAVLAGVRFLGRCPLPRPLAALFCGYGLAFVVLAEAKLFTYVRLYGATPRRAVAGWFLGVLAVWAVLLLVRVFRPLPAARIGLVVLAVSFTLLSCLDLESRIVRMNIDRYAAGVDADLDTEVLWDCGLLPWQKGRDRAKTVTYTRWLLEAGWFEGRGARDLEPFYAEAGVPFGAEAWVELDDTHTLHLTFDQSRRCTLAELLPAE